LTDPSPTKLRDLATGEYHTVSKVQPSGALQARRFRNGSLSFYWRYSLGKLSDRVLIGVHDPSAPPKKLEPTKAGYSFAAALRAAEALALEHHNARDQGGRPALEAAKLEAAARQAEADARAATATLKHLLLEYCDHQASLKRESHRNARSIFQLHVIDAFPHVAAKPASSVTADEFADIMRRLIGAGKARTANKLRSYARAAYQVALTSRTKPSTPERFKEFCVRTNPVAETSPDETANKADKNPLSLDEMRTYWSLLRKVPGFRGALLRLHVLTGGQRIEQLVRLRTVDIHEDHIVLYDGKGRPGHGARPHWVPLTKEVRAALRECKPRGTYALSTDGGETHVAGTTLSSWAEESARGSIPAFKAKRVRSGVETLLASARVPSGVRGELQSHGVAGVQRRHYDGHDYLEVKLEALELLHKLLTEGARVTKPGRRESPRRAG
jgi:integrase